MKLTGLLFTLLIIILLVSCKQDVPENEISNNFITDDLGNKIDLQNTPSRIISLAPNLTEFIYELGLEDKLIGNTLYCNYPDEANDITKVGDLLTIDLEKIVTLKPDIIFITVEGNTKDNYNKLIELGLTVFVSNPRDFRGIRKTTRDIAKIFGRDAAAESKIDMWQKRIDHVSEKCKDKPSAKTMFLVSLNPIMLAAKNTFVNGFLEVCNLENVTGDVEINYPFFNREDILERNPEIIIHTQENILSIEDVIKTYPEWSSLDAVKNERIYYVDPDLFHRPGPRYADAAEMLYSKLYK